MEEKIVEKQMMKLKLDTLIIQKGRMAPKHTGFGKEELQDMVNYGAASIFSLGDEVGDDDIDELIKEGKRKADDLAKEADNKIDKKMNLTDFQLDACNLY